MSLARRKHDAPELLDRPDHDPRVLEVSLRHVAQVNHWLGGTRSLKRTLAPILGAEGGSLLDIATGNGEVPIALVRWARRRKTPLTIHATDVNLQMLELAHQNCKPYPEITVQQADALCLPHADAQFTAALMTLALHHFEGADLQRALQEAARVSSRAIVVSELERGWPNYAGARFLAATWWRKDPLTRHDGPLSVLRSFTLRELRDLAYAAGLRSVRVKRRFFYRLVLTADGIGGA